MSTVYTLNGKVLKNSANDKWLKKKEAPAGFVMNASNATIEHPSGTNVIYVSWQSPSYPNGYDGSNKQCTIVNNNASGITIGKPTGNLMYGNSTTGGGPAALPTADLHVGTRTVTLVSNSAASAFGAYFVIPFDGNEEQVQAYLSNLTITILDP